MYFNRGKIKCLIGVATGKKLHDKRRDIAEKAVKRDLDRRLKERNYN
ncbi:MAG: SsrA-binding protein [Dialister micraerophilus]|nr:SsrA-binding protein [Dialister micraerophilus]